MHIEIIRFDHVFDTSPQRGDFSFTSAGHTTRGAILPSRAIPLPGDTLVMAYAKPGDWSTLLGYRDVRTGKTWLKHRSAWKALMHMEFAWWMCALAFAAGMTLAGATAAVLMSGAAGVAMLAVWQRRNGRLRKLLSTYA